MKNLLFLFFALVPAFFYAQDYDHYLIEFSVGNIQHKGVMAINTRTPRQVLRLAYYDPSQGAYRLMEERYTLDFDDGYFYLDNTYLSDRTYCYAQSPGTYMPDYFVFDAVNQAIWIVDAYGNLALVDATFIPMSAIDDFKPYFWPEDYGICGTVRWQHLMGALFGTRWVGY